MHFENRNPARPPSDAELLAPVLWNREEALNPSSEHRAVMYDHCAGRRGRYPGRRMQEYLHLGSDESYATGLTAFQGREKRGIIGLRSHGDDPQTIGSTRGYPLYFPLAPHERIVSVWLCTAGLFGELWEGPYLLVSADSPFPAPPFPRCIIRKEMIVVADARRR